MNKEKPEPTLHCVDAVAWECLAALIEDFRPFVSDSYYRDALEAITSRNLVRIRSIAVGQDLSPIEFKCQYQIQTWLKRYSFSNDLLSPEDVRAEAIEKFIANNQRLTGFTYELSPLTRRVLFAARGWIGNCLGDYISCQAIVKATFGKKSSVGVPARKANIAERYEHLTGSQEQILWHKHVYSAWDRPASRYASRVSRARKLPLYVICDELLATLVDKTWKSFRFIVPNTTIGTLQSSGMGRLLEDCLRRSGYDISALQPIHNRLAAEGSRTGQLVTADQSSASDNITCTLVRMLFEQRWADALFAGRIGKVKIDGTALDLATFSTMGNGVTFPLQTLVFLGLLKGVEDVLGLKNQTISVFGDDMIYPLTMHETVLTVFGELGLLINADKTFSTGDFRESCGGDYYRGYDVRPALMSRSDWKGNMAKSGRAYQAYLYKLINALKKRWSDDEIPSTLAYLLDQVRLAGQKEPLLVPYDYPDTAGVHSSLADIKNHSLTRTVRGSTGDFHPGSYHFSYLGFEPRRRTEFREWPYMYQSIRVATSFRDEFVFKLDGFRKILSRLGVKQALVHGVLRSDTPGPLRLEEDPDGPTGAVKRKRAEKQAPTPLVPTGVVIDAGRYRVAQGLTFG